MSRRSISSSERRSRLARRHRLAPGYLAPDPLSVARSMVCLHGTDPATLYLSARARMESFAVADLDRAFYTDRSLIKHLSMRRTLFAFPRETLPFAQAAASNRVAAVERRRLISEVESAGLHPDGAGWLTDVGGQVQEFLADGREATLAELRAAIPLLGGSTVYGVGKSWGGNVSVAPRVLTSLSAAGRIVRASNDGSWRTSRNRWSLMSAWLGAEPAQFGAAEGTRRMVEMWLTAFGPGSVLDIKWWLGSTLTAVRKALSELGAVEVEMAGSIGFVLPDDVNESAPVPPWAALLPPLDPTTMGWFERDWYLGPYKPQIFDSTGNAGPTAWWNGRIVGGWRQRPNGEVELQLLEDVGIDAMAELDSQAAALTEWMGGVRVLQRFPSPLSKMLGSPDEAL